MPRAKQGQITMMVDGMGGLKDSIDVGLGAEVLEVWVQEFSHASGSKPHSLSVI